MDDMFSTVNTPEPSQVYLHAIRDYWNDFMSSCDLPVIAHARLRFKYSWKDHEYHVNNEVSLRYAYKLWLKTGDTSAPFVLFVDDTNLDNPAS